MNVSLYMPVCLSVCLSVCQSHIFELLSIIHFAMQGTMYCPTTSSVHQLHYAKIQTRVHKMRTTLKATVYKQSLQYQLVAEVLGGKEVTFAAFRQRRKLLEITLALHF